ncbi:MAG: hypothetical protein U1E62_20355 [Alsobacter sp.]
MKAVIIALAASVISTSAFAQSVTIRTGDTDVVRRHHYDHGRHLGWRNHERVVVGRSIETTGTTCHSKTIRKTDDMGRTVVKHIRSC